MVLFFHLDALLKRLKSFCSSCVIEQQQLLNTARSDGYCRDAAWSMQTIDVRDSR
jgi:hypothetical protein